MKLAVAALIIVLFVCQEASSEDWERHVIDESFQGADGVRLADFNQDGLLDIVTGWEESGVIRLYLNPGPTRARSKWPSVTIGKAASPEDAVPIDLDGDGRWEVLSCHEGKKRQVIVHRNLAGTTNSLLTSTSNWQSERIDCLDGQMWMYATPIRLRDTRLGVVLGSKNAGGSITLWVPPAGNAEPLAAWKAIPLRSAGWIMSIEVLDMDDDGDLDIVASDRKGGRRGVFWLEQPDSASKRDWIEHEIGSRSNETLFIDVMRDRVLASTRNGVWLDLVRRSADTWEATQSENPANVPFGKSIRRLADGGIVLTANTAADRIKQPRPGIWVKRAEKPWQPIDSTPATKFDRIELVDLDGDGDQDVLTCEERQNLGVIWYENPGLLETGSTDEK